MAEEKSGIELLKEIANRLALLEQKVDILDRNMKIIINNTRLVTTAKISAAGPIVNPTPVVNEPKATEHLINMTGKTGFSNFKMEVVDASKAHDGAILAQKQRVVVKNIVCTGKMVTEADGKLVPLSDINVKIYNDKDVLVKETKTNRAGQWVSHLPSGCYVALFEGVLNGKALVPQNRNFKVPESLPEGQKMLEVT
jgi:hypothetical protein